VALLFAWAEAYRGRGGTGAFCKVGVLCLVTVKGLDSSSEDSTLRKGGREPVDAGTMGEKLPGARGMVGVPVVCDMVAVCAMHKYVSHNLHTNTRISRG
jgi:hypothetical protein